MEKLRSSVHIDYYGDLITYIKSLPENTQLRFLSTTALRGSFGVIVIVYNKDEEYVLLTPYQKTQTWKKPTKLDVVENPINTTIRCVQKEAGYEVDLQPVELGLHYVDDTKIKGKKFPKYTMLVTGYKGLLKRNEQIVSQKNCSPVWIKKSLLYYIFESEVHTEMEEHPHIDAYNDFFAYLRRNRVFS